MISLAQAGIYPIFIPVITGSANNRSFLCHYQIRLYDIVRNLGLVAETQILTGVFTFDHHGFLDEGFYEVGRALGRTDGAIADALACTRSATFIESRTIPANGSMTIGLLGRSYVVCDRWASMDLVEKLHALGCNVIREDDLGATQFYPEDQELHFTLSARTFQAARQMNARPDIDGLIFQIPFNCGPDGDIAGELIAEAKKPFLTLVVDELTGQEGLQTRLEAFLDVLSITPDLQNG